MTFGYVYILEVPNECNVFKIGHTHDLDKRVASINSATGLLHPLRLVYHFECTNPAVVEKRTHRILDLYRVRSNKEFFCAPIDTCIDAIKFAASGEWIDHRNKYPVMYREITSMESLGEQLRYIRKQRGIVMEEATTSTGVSVRCLSELERAHRSVGIKTLLKILKFLGLKMLIVGDIDEENASEG